MIVVLVLGACPGSCLRPLRLLRSWHWPYCNYAHNLSVFIRHAAAEYDFPSTSHTPQKFSLNHARAWANTSLFHRIGSCICAACQSQMPTVVTNITKVCSEINSTCTTFPSINTHLSSNPAYLLSLSLLDLTMLSTMLRSLSMAEGQWRRINGRGEG